MSNDTWCVFLSGFLLIDKRRLELLGGGALGVLLEKDGMDVGHDTSGRDGGGADELVELLIVLDGELDVARDDAGLLVVLGSVAAELEELGDDVLEDGGHVDRGTGTDALGEAALAEEAAQAADRESQTSLGGLGLASGGLLATSSLSTFAGHDCRTEKRFTNGIELPLIVFSEQPFSNSKQNTKHLLKPDTSLPNRVITLVDPASSHQETLCHLRTPPHTRNPEPWSFVKTNLV